MKVSDVIKRARVLLGDQKENIFTDEEYLSEINSILKEISSEVGTLRIEASIPVRENATVYEFPDDFLALQSISFDNYLNGRVILNSSYRRSLASASASTSKTSAAYWGFGASHIAKGNVGHIMYRETTSFNELRIEPPITAEDVSPSELGSDVQWSQ
jgi:hypothetical protein